MPAPSNGKHVLSLVFPAPIGILNVECFFDAATGRLTVPFLGTLTYDSALDIMAFPGGGEIALECLGGSWRGTVRGIPVGPYPCV